MKAKAGIKKLTTIILMGFIVFAASFPSRAAGTSFSAGTSVNGISISGRSVPDAVSILRQKYADYTLTVQEKNGKQEVLKGSDFGYSANITDADLQALLNRQNADASQKQFSVPIVHSLNEAQLEAKVNALNCISGAGIVATQDAEISAYQAGKAFSIIPEVYGNSVDAGKFLQAVKDAVAGGQPTVSIEGTGCYVAVNRKKEDAFLKTALDNINKCRTMTITYSIGENQEILDTETILGWIRGAEDNGQVRLDAGAIAGYINTLAAKYNTAGTERTFHTFAGADIALSGPLGWTMDTAAETAALTAMILTGQSQKRTIDKPVPDWGTSYIEADLSAQHVYFFRDGQVIWDSPCVSGATALDRGTPTGIFYIYNKETDRILRGPMKNGKPEYESHVDYWMPFSGGSGLHDAAWRNKFGNGIYVDSGSHGCVNLPSDKAAELYGLVNVGYPCIVHY